MYSPHTFFQRVPVRLSSFRIVVFTIALAVGVALPLGARAATPSLSCAPARLRFGTITLGQTEIQPVVLTNTGASSITISSTSASGAEFTVSGLSLPFVLAAGDSVALNVTFAPTEGGWNGEQITFSTESSGSLELPVAGTGANGEPLVAKPSNLSFGQVTVGKSETLSLTLTNALSREETLTAFQVAGTGFTVSGPTLPVTLSSGNSITLNVTYAPTETGASGGSIFVSGGSLNIPMFGTGGTVTVGQLSVAPTTLNFGSVELGTTETEQPTLTATGGSVTITSASSSAAQFAISGVTFPLTISAGQSIPFNALFTPQTTGAASATLSFSSNATNSTTQETLDGTGAAPYVALSWNASTSQVSGYNVYRGANVNSYVKINPALDAQTTYTDNAVTPGATYYYAATSVSANGEESGYSSPIVVQVP